MYLARLLRHPSRRKRAGEGEEKSSSSKGRRRKRTVGVCSTWMAEAVRRLVGRGDRQDSALSLPLCLSLFPLPSLAFHSAACACVPLRSAPARFEYRQGGEGRLDASEWASSTQRLSTFQYATRETPHRQLLVLLTLRDTGRQRERGREAGMETQ